MGDKVTFLLLTILGVMVFAWALQGVRLYKSYRGDIYSALFGSFFPYFYKYVILRDCSESGYLRSQIGCHRLIFTMTNNDEGQKSRFCVVLYSHGIMVICYDRATGQFRGNTGGKTWNVIRTDKDGTRHAYRHPAPAADLRAYCSRMRDLYPGVHLEMLMAFCDAADISQLSGPIKAVHFKDLVDELKAVESGTISEDEIQAMYKKLIR